MVWQPRFADKVIRWVGYMCSGIMIISDSSTLILLTKCGLIEPFLSDFSLIIPKTVYNEAIRKGVEMGKYDVSA